MKNITAKIDRSMNPEQISAITADLQKAVNYFTLLTERMQKEDNIGKTTLAIRDAGKAVTQSSESLESTLFKLNATLDKLTLLLNLLNANPSALIHGKEAKSSEIK